MAARRIRILIGSLIVGAVLTPSMAWAQRRTAPAPAPVSDLPNYVSYLAWQLRGKHLDESGEITGKIQKAVLDHMQTWLAADPARVESVAARRELERIFYNLRYPTTAMPSCFDHTWKGSTVLGVGYTLGWTNRNRASVLAIFQREPDNIRLVTVTKFIPMVDLHYELHPPVGSDDFWFFAWGTRAGKSQPRLSVIFYSFDGEKLKPLWETRDVFDGKMDVGETQVRIRYLKEAEYIREQAHGRKPSRYEVTYRITPMGLEVESDREIPF